MAYLWRFTLLAGLAIGLIVGIAAAAPVFWFEFLYGAEFVEHADLVIWWAFAFMLSFLNRPAGYGLRATEHTRPIFWAQLWAAVFSVVCSYPLAHHFGLLGVMTGIVVLNAFRSGIVIMAFQKHVSRLA